MHLSKREDFLTLTADPGDATGWCLADGNVLLAAGTTPLWHFADDIYINLAHNYSAVQGTGLYDQACWLDDDEYGYFFHEKHPNDSKVKRIICEDFRIYPEKARSLAWDQLRTPRLIGAITMLSRIYEVDMHLQPAAIKKAAEAAGAEEFFYRPLEENRHQNDAIRHWWYYASVGPEGKPGVPNNKAEDA